MLETMTNNDNESMDLASLESRVDELIKTVEALKTENSALKNQQESLVNERAVLIEKTEQARTRIESMIGRLRAMETTLMSAAERKPVNITILEKEYLITCSDEEREQLHSAVEMLNERINQVKDGGNVIGSERITVMAALNIAHELIAYRQKNQVYTSKLDDTIQRLQSKIHSALGKGEQLEI